MITSTPLTKNPVVERVESKHNKAPDGPPNTRGKIARAASVLATSHFILRSGDTTGESKRAAIATNAAADALMWACDPQSDVGKEFERWLKECEEALCMAPETRANCQEVEDNYAETGNGQSVPAPVASPVSDTRTPRPEIEQAIADLKKTLEVGARQGQGGSPTFTRIFQAVQVLEWTLDRSKCAEFNRYIKAMRQIVEISAPLHDGSMERTPEKLAAVLERLIPILASLKP